MKLDARKLSTDEKAKLRRNAVMQVQNGESVASVTRRLGLGEKTIYKWIQTVNKHGMEGLAPQPRPGRTRVLTHHEEARIFADVVMGHPSKYGYQGDLWTRQLVLQHVYNKLNIKLSLSAITRMLHRFGLAPRLEIKRLFESDDPTIMSWIHHDYEDVAQFAKNEAAEIFWLKSLTFDKPVSNIIANGGATAKGVPMREPEAIVLFSRKGEFACQLFDEQYQLGYFIELLEKSLKNRDRPVGVVASARHLRGFQMFAGGINLDLSRLRTFECPDSDIL